MSDKGTRELSLLLVSIRVYVSRKLEWETELRVKSRQFIIVWASEVVSIPPQYLSSPNLLCGCRQLVYNESTLELEFFFSMMKKIWLPKLHNQELVTHATFSLSLSDLLIRLWPYQWSSVNSQLPWAVACWHWHPQWTWVCRCLLSSTKLTNLTMVWWSDLLLLRALRRGYLGWRWRHHVLASWTWVMCGVFSFFYF